MTGDYCETDGCIKRVPPSRRGRYCRSCGAKRCKPASAETKAKRLAQAKAWNKVNADRHRVHSNRCYWRRKLEEQGFPYEYAKQQADERYPYPERETTEPCES